MRGRRLTVMVILVSAVFGYGIALAGVNEWTSIGPYGPPGGTINSLVIDPSNPSTIYAGTPSGVFKSTDGGANWIETNEGLPMLNISGIPALAIDPSTPSTLYAGTYEGSVFRSTDGGATWFDLNEGWTALAIRKIVVDPTTSTTLYAGTSAGLYKSTDGGTSWSYLSVWSSALPVYDLIIDPFVPTAIYVATINCVFKSTDGGVNWFEAKAGLPDLFWAYALAIDPSTPSTVYVGTTQGIYKSTDRGANWFHLDGSGSLTANTLVVNPLTPSILYARTDFGIYKSPDAGSTWSLLNGSPSDAGKALIIDPSVPDTLYAGTLCSGVYLTTDGGATWVATSTGLPNPSIYIASLVVDPSASTTLYAASRPWGEGECWFGGAFKSTDGGATWTEISSGLLQNGVNTLAIDPHTPTTLYAGTKDGVFKSTDGGDTWSEANTGLYITVPAQFTRPAYTYIPEVQFLAVAPSISTTLYAICPSYYLTSAVFGSTNGGANWEHLFKWGAGTWMDFLVVDPSTPATLYVGAMEGGILKSTDGGATWTEFSSGLALVIDPVISTTLYRGSNGIFKSTDGGSNWSAVNTGLPTDTNVHILAIAPSNSAYLYASAYKGGNIQTVFKSTDGGANWSEINTDLPKLTIQTFAVDPSSSTTLYAGTDNGVYKYESVSDGGSNGGSTSGGGGGGGCFIDTLVHEPRGTR